MNHVFGASEVLELGEAFSFEWHHVWRFVAGLLVQRRPGPWASWRNYWDDRWQVLGRDNTCLFWWSVMDIFCSFGCHIGFSGPVTISDLVPLACEWPWIELLTASLRPSMFCHKSSVSSHKRSNCLVTGSVAALISLVTCSDVKKASGVLISKFSSVVTLSIKLLVPSSMSVVFTPLMLGLLIKGLKKV